MPTITFELTDDHAFTFAQFLKRIGWTEFRKNAVDENEADLIKKAHFIVRDGLAEAGFNPRYFCAATTVINYCKVTLSYFCYINCGGTYPPRFFFALKAKIVT